VPRAVLPVGFEQFQRRSFVNYQFNRAYALGFADHAELCGAASQVRSPQHCVSVFEDLSRRAAADGRQRQATSYLRVAEFFTPPRSAAKVERYRRYQDLFDFAFADDGLIRHEVPYGDATLPADLLPAAGRSTRGTVIMHGGLTH